MGERGNRPAVTFYVMAYNQERFIREAVAGALAQTYSPLQIVLSDDCSADGTFDIMQEMVKAYAGPHTIVLNRNDRNVGISEHVNRITALATGELIVAADGDDVSAPHRTERFVDAWLENGKPAAMFSSVTCIDATGRVSKTRDGGQWIAQFVAGDEEAPLDRLRRFFKHGSPRLISCSAAWTRALCDAFGPLPSNVWFEDDVMSLRAWLFDRIVFIPEALVSYREHDANVANCVDPVLTTRHARRDAEQARRTEARRRRESLASYKPDLALAVRHQWITPSLREELERQIETRCVFHRVIEDWWHVRWTTRLALLVFLIRSGRMRELRWCSPRLLPLPIFLLLGAVWRRARMIGFLSLPWHCVIDAMLRDWGVADAAQTAACVLCS